MSVVEDTSDVASLVVVDDGAPGALARYRRLRWGMAVSDVVCVLVALGLSYVLRFGLQWKADHLLALAVATVLWAPVFHAYGLYSTQHVAASEEFRRIIGATSIGVLLVVLASFFQDSAISRLWVAATWLIALVLELTTRRIWHHLAWRLKKDGRLALRTLIVGANEEAARLAHALGSPGLGFKPLGYVATSGGAVAPDGLPLTGRIEDLSSLIRSHRAECVFVASSALGTEDTLTVVQSARQTHAEVRVSANLPQILTSRLSVQPVGEVMALSLKPVRLTGTQTLVKRAFDLTVAFFLVLLLLPLLGVIAAAIKLTSKGPVLFRQKRITKGGRGFVMYKFRTMLPDADKLLGERVAEISVPFFKLEDDPRLTRVGKVLRSLSLDELPQLLNVMRGDISLVGPRPLTADQVATSHELLAPRHEVLAGVTGWWQINGRSDRSPEEALRLDLFYIENWSLSLDLYILAKTFGAIIARRGAY